MGEGLSQEQKWFKDSCITKAHPGMGDRSWKQETSRSQHNLQTAQQVRECPFQVTQLVCASCRQLSWLCLPECNFLQSLRLIYVLVCVWRGGERVVNLISFRNFLKILSSLFTFWISHCLPPLWTSCYIPSFIPRWKVLSLRNLLHTKHWCKKFSGRVKLHIQSLN